MIYYLALFLICWFMIFTAGRFLKFFKVENNYKEHTVAEVIALTPSSPESAGGKKKKDIDITLRYEIEGKAGSTELTMPADAAQNFGLGDKIPVRYMISGNGAVHLASDTENIKALLIGHGAALIVELASFVIIWSQMI